MWPQYGYGWKGNLASAADRPMVIGEDVNVVPIPVVNKGDTHYSTLGGNGLVVFKTSDEAQQNSWKFLQTLMEDDVNLEADTKLGQLPSLLTLQGNSFFDDPSEQPFVQQTLTALPGEPYAAADTIAAYVLNAIQASVVDGSVSVEDAIAQAAQKARADLQ
jgi:multiple sugar transport system substrate-binding protein